MGRAAEGGGNLIEKYIAYMRGCSELFNQLTNIPHSKLFAGLVEEKFRFHYTVDMVLFVRFFFANFARRTNSRIQESRENYYNSATEENCKFEF